MKDYKQQLKEGFENKFKQPIKLTWTPSRDISDMSHDEAWINKEVRDYIWNWISTKLDELEAKTRRESVEGFATFLDERLYGHYFDEELTINGNLLEILHTVVKEYLSTQSKEEGKE